MKSIHKISYLLKYLLYNKVTEIFVHNGWSEYGLVLTSAAGTLEEINTTRGWSISSTPVRGRVRLRVRNSVDVG